MPRDATWSGLIFIVDFFVCVILSVTHFFVASGAGGSVHQFSVELWTQLNKH